MFGVCFHSDVCHHQNSCYTLIAFLKVQNTFVYEIRCLNEISIKYRTTKGSFGRMH